MGNHKIEIRRNNVEKILETLIQGFYLGSGCTFLRPEDTRHATLAEQHDVVPGQQGALDLGNDRVIEADDAGEGGLPGRQACDEVGADLLLDRAWHVPARAQCPQGAGEVRRDRGSEAGHATTVRQDGRHGARRPERGPISRGPV